MRGAAVRRAVGPRGWWSAATVSLLVVGVGCDAQAGPATPPDRLVFELGGDAAPLAAALRSAAKSASPAPVVVPKPDPQALGGLPAPTRIAILADGETLGELCARELGTAARWPEVAALNNFGESELRSLTPGTRVRLPMR